jgi:uncharacterized protein (TIGR03382 family)
MHWVGWSAIALVAVGVATHDATGGAGILLAFAVAAAVGVLIRKRALTLMGGAGALALTVGMAYGAQTEPTWGILLAGVGATGLMLMPWRMRNPWA